MSIIPKVKNSQLELKDQTLTLQMSLHEGVQLLAELDEQLALPDNNTDQLVKGFYQNLLQSVMLLGTRERQLLLNETSLRALACLLRRFRGQKLERDLRENLSQRRIGQVEEEALYSQASLSTSEELAQVLKPFFSHINEQIKEGKIKLQDPKGIYF